MKVSISVGSAYYNGDNWEDLVEYVCAADRLGVDSVWSAEAWGMEAVASLGYLAARTERIGLGSGIMQISARTPAATAMSALALDRLSNGRFRLGLGVSGPQVVEGLHGEAFANPLERLREYTEIVRMAINGERVVYNGKHYVLPRPGGEGKALKLAIPPNPNLPIYLATLGPKSLELTGEIADGWIGTSLVADHADVLLDPIRRARNERGGPSTTSTSRSTPSWTCPTTSTRSSASTGRQWPSPSAGWDLPGRTSTTRHSPGPGSATSPPKCSVSGSEGTSRPQ